MNDFCLDCYEVHLKCYCNKGDEFIEDEFKPKDFKNCKHPYIKQGCCDYCGKDIIGE